MTEPPSAESTVTDTDPAWNPDPDAVWHNTIDDGAFDCKVTRIDAYHGRLVVRDTSDEEALLEVPVTFSHGAVFGPDADDVGLWEDMCIAAVDMMIDR